MLRNWSLNPLAKVAIGILRSYGTNAHIYLPGVGTISGLTAGNYLDSAGTTAASVDNPVGLILDAAGSVGVELVPTTIPSVSGVGWTTNGTSITATNSTASGTFSLNATTAVTKLYQVTFTASDLSGATSYMVFSSGVAASTKRINVAKLYSFVVPGQGTAAFEIAPYEGTAFSVTIDNISVREIPGIHATQATTANKAILRRGLLNKLLWSNDLTNAAWTKNATTYSGGQLIESASSAQHQLNQTVTVPATGIYTYVASAKQGAGAQRFLNVYPQATSVGWAIFDLLLGTVTASGGGGLVAASIAPDPSSPGKYLCAVSLTATAASVASVVYLTSTNSTPAGVYLGDGLSSVYIYGAGLFQGTLTAQQIIDAGGIPLTTSAAASSATGKYWWSFDGSNDSLSLSAPLFQMSDDHCVIAGLNPTTSATDMAALNFGSGAGAQMVGCLLVTNNGFAKAAWWDDTTLASVSDATNHFGATFVASARKIGNSKTLTVNGVQVGAADTTVMGATTIGTGVLGGYSAAAGGKFTGSIYPAIAIRGTVSDAELMVLEKYVGMCCGVSI